MFKSTTLIFTVAIAFYVTPIHAQQPQGVNLAEMQDWNIVIADDAIASEVYAAEEFQEFFSQASGLKLPIVHKITRWDKHVFIGPGKVMRSSNVGFEIGRFGDEDLRIVIRDGNIAIAGGRPRGTLYGVYTFLEDYLSMRFLTHDHTHVPPVGDTQVVGPIDTSYQPPLEYRHASYGENVAYPKLAARLRNNAAETGIGGHAGIENINHSFYRQVMVQEYHADHPEYYAMLDIDYEGPNGVAGKRSRLWYSQPCLINPEVLKIVAQAVREEFKSRPDVKKNVSVSQNDGDGYCTCENCGAIDKREESHMGSLLAFVNAVADEIAKTHPNVKIGTLAYNYSQKPPKTIRPRPNVQIQLCSVRCRPTRPINDPTCAQNEGFRRALAGWSRICNDIGIWNYNLNHHHYLIPNPNMRVVEPNIRFFVANNVRRVFMQSPHGMSTEFSDLKNYVASRLLWNPKLNSRQLRDEFLRLHYGQAAGPIGHYLDLLHNKAEAVTKSYMHFAGRTDNFGIDKEVIQAGLKAFETALELVGDDEVLRARVEKALICAYAAAVAPARYWGEDQGVEWNNQNYPKKAMPPEIARTRPYAKRLFELCKIYRVPFWADGVSLEKGEGLIRRTFGLKKDEPL